MTTTILITGATGYIGGTVLDHLLKSKQDYHISALIRDEKQGPKLESLGVKPIVFKGLDDLETIRKASEDSDLVINTASSSHDASIVAILEGQSKRKEDGKKSLGLIHNAGTSILSDRNGGNYSSDTVLSDLDDVYSFEKNHPETYSQRVADIAAFENAERLKVDLRIICPPTIFGEGSGPFSTLSQQVPNLIRAAVKEKVVVMVGKGLGIWDHTHVQDVASLFEFITRKVVQGEQVPEGKEGFFFTENGHHTWLQVAEGIAKSLKQQGVLPTEEIKSVSIQHLADLLGLPTGITELALAANSRSRSEKARKMGWTPSVSNEEFFTHFDDEVRRTLLTIKQ